MWLEKVSIDVYSYNNAVSRVLYWRRDRHFYWRAVLYALSNLVILEWGLVRDSLVFDVSSEYIQPCFSVATHVASFNQRLQEENGRYRAALKE